MENTDGKLCMEKHKVLRWAEGTNLGAGAEHTDWVSETEDSNVWAFVLYLIWHSHFSLQIKICIVIAYWQDFLMET